MCILFLPFDIVFPYFALFTGYEDDIFEVIANLHVHRSKFGGKLFKNGEAFFVLLMLQTKTYH